MELLIEPTQDLFSSADGTVPVRRWVGVTDAGTQVFVYVCAIQPMHPGSAPDLERELLQLPGPPQLAAITPDAALDA